jgi:hypothetical protein
MVVLSENMNPETFVLLFGILLEFLVFLAVFRIPRPYFRNLEQRLSPKHLKFYRLWLFFMLAGGFLYLSLSIATRR